MFKSHHFKRLLVFILIFLNSWLFSFDVNLRGQNKYLSWETEIFRDLDKYLVVFSFTLKEKIHINSNQPLSKNYIPTVLEMLPDLNLELEKVEYPPQIINTYYQEELSVYEGNDKKNIRVFLKARDKVVENDLVVVPFIFSYQPCDEQFCFPPEQIKLTLKKRVSAIERKTLDKVSFNQNFQLNNNLPFILLWAFIGGLFLNFMPCVFPLISIKAYSLVRILDQDQRVVRRKGIMAFILGGILSFLGLGLVLILFKSFNQQINWGLQFQNPYYVLILVIIFWGLAFNLLGVFNLKMNFSYSFTPSVYSAQQIVKENFLSGIFITLFSSSCLAPFLGVALGYAFTQNNLIIFFFFLVIGLGFISPYFLLLTPFNLKKILPASGPWLDIFKKISAFPIFLVIIWLLNILYFLTNFETVFNTLIFFCCLAFFFFTWGKIQKKLILNQARKHRFYSWLGFLTFLTITIFFLFFNSNHFSSKESNIFVSNQGSSINQQIFTKQKKEGNLFFMHYTAKWCLNCQVNELVLEQKKVKTFFQKKNIQYFVADWTKPNDFIAGEITRLGRVGIPLDIFYYYKNNRLIPYILPVILTEKNIKSTFREIEF